MTVTFEVVDSTTNRCIHAVALIFIKMMNAFNFLQQCILTADLKVLRSISLLLLIFCQLSFCATSIILLIEGIYMYDTTTYLYIINLLHLTIKKKKEHNNEIVIPHS